ncbi:MAG: hypothetical protein NWP69_08575 [Congregibacter sp.]|nr:hypothetical protein [Congregibacter sp.]MDP5069466.1 hypothetical protein [Congregibacter sp.]
MASAMLAVALFSGHSHAQTQPYSYYGGDIEAAAKNPEIEACEYRELVENQRCNRRANKTACIDEVHDECREKHASQDDLAPLTKPIEDKR